MQTIHWLFLTSVALFLSGIALVIAGARSMEQAPPPAVEAPVTTPVASIRQIMNGIVMPSANVVYGAVATIINENGIEERAPSTDAEWEEVGTNAAALVESANLLMMGSRALDDDEWIVRSRAFMDAAKTALEATDARSVDGLLEAGGVINETCDACHVVYMRSGA